MHTKESGLSLSAGSYVAPADLVAALGDGNSALGKLVMDEACHLLRDGHLLAPDAERVANPASPPRHGSPEWITMRARTFLDRLRDPDREAVVRRTSSMVRKIAALRTKSKPRKRTTIEQQAHLQRITDRSLLQVLEQRFESSNRNPLHVWAAIEICTKSRNNPLPLPRWCTEYLYTAAERLSHIAAVHGLPRQAGPKNRSNDRTGKQQPANPASVVSEALGFTRRGKSAFKGLATDIAKIEKTLQYHQHMLAGLTREEALKAVDGLTAGHDGTLKAIQAGKRLLTHVPQSARLAPRE